MQLFSDIQYSFRASRLTTELLRVAIDKIVTAFTRSWATSALAGDI